MDITEKIAYDKTDKPQDSPNQPANGSSNCVGYYIIELSKAKLKFILHKFNSAGQNYAGDDAGKRIPEFVKSARKQYPHGNEHDYVFNKHSPL